MRITSRQLRQLIREELLREAAPVTSDPALMQYMAQMGIGEGEMTKTAELYGLLKRLGPEKDGAVLGAALNSVIGEVVYLATSSVPPRVTSVRVRPSTKPEDLLKFVYNDEDDFPPMPKFTGPEYLATYNTSADGTVGSYTLKSVNPAGKLVFELGGAARGAAPRSLILTPDQVIRYLENCMTLSKQMRAISSEIYSGRGPVYDMVVRSARLDKIPRAGLKSILAWPEDTELADLLMLSDDVGAQAEAPEFFTSY